MSGWAVGLAGGWPTAVWRQSGEVNLANLAISPVVPKQMEKAHAATKQRQHLRQRINNHTCGNESRTVLVATEQIKIPHAATKQRKHQRCQQQTRTTPAATKRPKKTPAATKQPQLMRQRNTWGGSGKRRVRK